MMMMDTSSLLMDIMATSLSLGFIFLSFGAKKKKKKTAFFFSGATIILVSHEAEFKFH